MNKRKTKSAYLENKRTLFLEIGFILALSVVFFALEYKSYDKIIHLDTYHSNYQEKDVLPPLILKT